MSRPDLSFLARAEHTARERLAATEGASVPAPAPAAVERRSADRPTGRVAELIGELRATKAELESQNEVLRYSQAAAEAASERFEALFASVPIALIVVDEQDLVVQANPMAHRSFQPTEQSRPLTALLPFVHPHHAERVRLAFEEARRRGDGDATAVAFVIGDTRIITGDLHIACIETPQAGQAPLQQFLCAVIDQGPLLAKHEALQHSTEVLQERNEQLYQSERRLESIINSALDAIICVDEQQRITVFNPTAAALFVCATQDALGSPLQRFLPDAAQALAFAQLTTQAMLGEMTARTASGKDLAVEVSVSFDRRSDGGIVTVFARDLTGRKRAEEHRNALEAQLRESHKMQAMGTMAGGIAHDFNNILSAILGNVDLAKADCAPGSSVLESLHEIEKAGRRARDLVRQILTFSRNEVPQRGAVSVAEALHDTERLLRVTLPPTVTLEVSVPEGLPPMLADATQVEQAVLNLCTNAVHALGDARGAVRVAAALLHPDTLLAERLKLPAAAYIGITVTDTGPGMDAATLQRIFDPFFTTKPVGQGTGLGLSVVHGVMRTHGGAVDVHSVPGEGSRFTLYFPVASQSVPVLPSAQPVSAPPPAPAPGQRKRHIIYVDDDQALVFLVQRLLKRRGYEVSGFSDPQEALEALRAAPSRYDLIVTDYNMPGFSGIDLLREARAIRADLPVAVASGYVTTEIEHQAHLEGANALFHKPNDVDELCATVDRLVHPG